jgi:hypothetical protein
MTTPLIKRKFYIIAHNPNTIAEAKAYLEAGANALEPDICVSNGKFFVSHDHSPSSNPFTDEHNLVAYLKALRRLIIAEGKKINLALIMWDFKDADAPISINTFMQVVYDNFSKFPECAGIAMGVTNGSLAHIDFLTKYNPLMSDGHTMTNVAVGIDEEKHASDVSAAFALGRQARYSYANGIITTGIKLGVFESMLAAKGVQATDPGLKLIYTWVMADSDAMRDFLHIGIDGIIVNLGTVPTLKAMLLEKDFAPKFELAKVGYNPWSAPAIPTYFAEIHTADVYLAGTDAVIQFNLIGTGGALDTTLNADYKDVLEQAQTDVITFDGANIGTITSLKATALTSDISSDWLPTMIKVTSNADSNVAFFNYGADDWLKKGAPLTKNAQSAPST